MKAKVCIFLDKLYQNCVYQEFVETRTFSPTIAKWIASTTVEVYDTEADENGEILPSSMADSNGTVYVEVSHKTTVYRITVDCFNEPHYFATNIEKVTQPTVQ